MPFFVCNKTKNLRLSGHVCNNNTLEDAKKIIIIQKKKEVEIVLIQELE